MRWSRLQSSRAGSSGEGRRRRGAADGADGARPSRAPSGISSLVPSDPPAKVAVLGGGSFGTSISLLVARKFPNVPVALLVRREAQAREISGDHANSQYLPGVKLPSNVAASTDPAEVLRGADRVIHAVPLQQTRQALAEAVPHFPRDLHSIIALSKGLELDSGKTVSQVIRESLGPPLEGVEICVVSGPSFAVEIAEGCPTSLVAASRDDAALEACQDLLVGPTLRVNTTHDVTGVELCGALKNVLALAAGIIDGMGLGRNAMAALVAQGCSEIRWLATEMGAYPTTVAGLAGVGDIMLTCFNDMSRNRTVGLRIGRGESLDDILGSTGQVVEGVKTAAVVASLARRYGVYMPVLTAVSVILEGQVSAREAVEEVMNLPQQAEV